MAQKVKIKAILKSAINIKVVWEANPRLIIGDIDLKSFMAIYSAAEELANEYSTRRVELIGLKKERDDKTLELSRLITRFRSGVYGHFGPDSVEYGQTGATRRSERKRPRRKVSV